MKAAAAGGTKFVPGGAAKARELPPPGKRIADFGTDISVDDYLTGKSLALFFFFFCFFVFLMRRRIGRGATGRCSACSGDNGVCHSACGEGWRSQRWR